MAYITAEQTRAIKKALTKDFPEFKFSVRNSNHTSVRVVILSGPVRFDLTEEAKRRRPDYGSGYPEEPKYQQLNHYHLDSYENSELLKGMVEIINWGNYDNSDPMTDYFDVGFYVTLTMGEWDKPYVVTK